MNTFQEFELKQPILQALEELGFTKPTPVQTKVIPHLIKSNDDLVALAQTGTGKTAAFSLPVIQKLDPNTDVVQALILCPTRELAMQVADDIKNYSKYIANVSVAVVYGGEPIDRQIRNMKKRPQIVVGTPGRVKDLIDRRVLKIGAIRWLVLDEADEMLNMGFKDELDSILETTPKSKQVLLFSATMDPSVRSIANSYMKNSQEIAIGEKNKGSDNVKHFYYVVHEKDRYQALRRIADVNPDIHGIVFCRTRRETQLVADKLIQDHYAVEAIHGDVSQEQRTHVMNRFKNKKIQLLVATDVAARGIDVSGLTHVINYNLPDAAETYVHRSGRTGRANNLGVSLVIVNMREQSQVRQLERKVGKRFEQAPIPGGAEICEKQLFSLVDKMCEVKVNEQQIEKYLDVINKKFEGLSREELIAKFVSTEFNKFLEHYQNAPDLNVNSKNERGGEREVRTFTFARFRLGLGRTAGFGVKDLFSLLNEFPGMKGAEVGHINIETDSTTFEIEEQYADKVMKCFENGSGVEIVCEEKGIVGAQRQKNNRNGRGGGNNRPRRPQRRGDNGSRSNNRRGRY